MLSKGVSFETRASFTFANEIFISKKKKLLKWFQYLGSVNWYDFSRWFRNVKCFGSAKYIIELEF